jgi:hypothetical protein
MLRVHISPQGIVHKPTDAAFYAVSELKIRAASLSVSHRADGDGVSRRLDRGNSVLPIRRDSSDMDSSDIM